MINKEINKEKYIKITKYGLVINTKEFIIETLFIVSVIIVFSQIFKIKFSYTIILFVLSLSIIPLALIAWKKQINCILRFNLLTDYLSNIIPIFIQKSKIRYALSELSLITSDIMKTKIEEAISYIDNTKDDPELFKNALKIIEKEFPNSRVKSIHKFLLSVENMSSTNIKDIANNLYEDVEGWIKRTYIFQKDLKNRRNKIIILCLMTLMMNMLFVYIYSGYEFFKGFTDNIFYQISSTAFIIIIIIVITLVLTKLNGEWLINDIEKKDEELLIKRYEKYRKGKPKLSIIEVLLTLIFVSLGIYLFIIDRKEGAYALFIFAAIFITQKGRNYSKAKRYIYKNFEIEFPIWLREISLSLGSLTVLNSIENSINTVSYPFRKELRKFIKKSSKNPTSIKPYNDFLNEYDLEDARSSMRVLYAINNVSKQDMKQRVANLIVRNQTLLSKAESIRNNDSIVGIEALGYVPIIVFCFQITSSMFIMFFYMMNNLGNAI